MLQTIDYLTNRLIAGVNNRESLPQNTIEVIRGDTGGIDWQFVEPFVGAVEIDDNGASPDLPLTMTFGAKLPGDYAGEFLISSTTFSKIGSGATTIYRMPISLNTTEINDELVDGVVTQTVADAAARLALTGLLAGAIVGQSNDGTYWQLDNAAAPSVAGSWSVAPQKSFVELDAQLEVILDSRIFSTLKFTLRVNNDVIKGNEGVPTSANPSYPAPGDILVTSDINDTVIGTDQLGAAEGVATLDSGGTIPLDQLPDSIVGQVEYKGAWDADANTPDLTDLTGLEKGWYYVVTEPGASDPDSAGRTFLEGDWIVYNGATWDKIRSKEPVATSTVAGIIKRATAAQTNAQRLDDAAVTPANLRSQSTANLAAALTLTASSDLRQILAPQTTDRDVNLPVINAAPTGDQVGYGHCYSIIHDGSVNSLLVKNSGGTLQVRIDAGESAWLCATSSGWIAVKTFRAGVVSIIYPGIDLTAAPGNVTIYTPVAGMQFLATGASVRNDTVSGTIATPAQIQIDNGTDGNDIFANLTLTSPATGRYFNFAAATQPRIADSANPIRLRRTVAAAGTTPVHTATIIIDGRLI